MIEQATILEDIASVRADAIALRSGGDVLTYGELQARSKALAEELADMGLGMGGTVVICAPRSFAAIVAQLAVMRAGAAYVPVDPGTPDDRVRMIVQDAGVSMLIAPKTVSERLKIDTPSLDVETWTPRGEGKTLPTASGEDLAYVIYTSGSTGVPKGVEITHANLRHLVRWHLEAFGVSGEDRASHLAGLGFDASVWEVWPYLAVGATVVLAEDATRVDPLALREWLVANEITIAFVPTPLAEPMLAMHWPVQTKLRVLLTGGDTLHYAPPLGLPFPVVNNYGPTECTVVATSGLVTPGSGGLPSIGRAILGTTAYVLDEQCVAVAPGEMGELVIGGAGVGRGYRNLPEATAKSFIADPFSGGRMYRTGDRVRLLPNGELAFQGRTDGQEKIRGNRLELEEIVSVLGRHESVVACTTVARLDNGSEKHLVAYVQMREAAKLSARELREFLAASLPDYMIPAKFVRVMAIPLTPNGKVDRAALPLPALENALSEEHAIRQASSELEEALLAIVRELLRDETVGVGDDFFLVGGHSLLGTQLVLRARAAFEVKLTLRDLFEASTVAALAVHIENLILAEVDAMTEEDATRLAENA
jgi:amino acid adenylation domain-containing protein